MADVATLGLKVESQSVEKGTKSLDRLKGAAKRAEAATKGLSSTATRAGLKVRAANDNMSRSANMAAAAFGRAKMAALAFGAALGFAAGAGYRKFISNSIAAQNATAQLEAVLRSTGHAAGLAVGDLVKMSSEFQNLTTYGDEAVQSAQGVLLTFTRIGKDAFKPATAAVLDMATALRMDLKSAAILVGKALNDPVLGATALSRSGIQFTKVQKDMIKSMVEAGNMAGAQSLIMKELETQFKGSAEAARGTLGGALKSLSNVWGDLFEVSKKGSGELKASIENLAGVLSSSRVKEMAEGIGVAMMNMTASIMNGLAAISSALPTIIKTMGVLAAATGTWLALLVGAGIAAAIGQVVALQMALGATSITMALYAAVTKGAAFATNLFTAALARNPFGILAVALASIIAYFVLFKSEVKIAENSIVTFGDVAAGIFTAVKQSVGTMVVESLGLIVGMVAGINAAWSGIPGAMAGFAAQGANAVISIFAMMVNVVINQINTIKSALNSAISVARSLAKTKIGTLMPGSKFVAGLNDFAMTKPFKIEKLKNEYKAAGDSFGAAFSDGYKKGIAGLSDSVKNALGIDGFGNGGFVDSALEAARHRSTARSLDPFGGAGGAVSTYSSPAAYSTTSAPVIPRGGGGGGGGGGAAAQAMAFKDANAALLEYNTNLQSLQSLLAAGKITNEQYAEAFEKIRLTYLNTKNDFMSGVERGFINVSKSLGTWASGAEKMISGIFSKAEDAIVGFVTTGKIDFKKLIDSMISDMVRLMVRMLIMKPLAKMFGGIFSGGASGGGGLFGGLFANGAAFDNGKVTAFANGGIVSSPTVFPFASGVGLMGEAGPEAILPLSRGRNGKLGVTAANSGSMGVVNNISINVEGGSSGDSEKDQELAERISEALADTLNDRIDDRIWKQASYGGSLNPRGA